MLALALIAVLQTGAANVETDCLVERFPASKEEREISRAGWARTTKAARAFGARMQVQPEATALPAGLDAAFRSGFVGVSFVLTAEGRVRDCTVAVSSGIPALDDASCALLLRHGVAQPKMVAGAPVNSSVRVGVLWHRSPNPDDRARCGGSGGAVPVIGPDLFATRYFAGRRLPDGKAVMLRLAVSAGGIPGECRVVAATAAPEFGERACLAAVETMRFLPAVDQQGRFVPAIATRVVHFTQR